MTAAARNTEDDYRQSPLYGFAVRSKLYRPFVILRGLYRTYVSRSYGAYQPETWWDAYYDGEPIDDTTTLTPGKERLPTLYHYNATENLILRHLFNHGYDLTGQRVLDVGSGAGHWLQFYRSLGAASVTGVEISRPAADALSARFQDDPGIEIRQGDVTALDLGADFDVINAIGVMFHIVDDDAFHRTVATLVGALKPGGLLIVGGHFGVFDNLNVQFDRDGRVNKRLRSRRHWRRLLKACDAVEILRNDAYRHIDSTLPENNILIATR